MDWNGMTTRKGASIEIHFEDEVIEHKLVNSFPTKEAILERLRQSVETHDLDTDSGKIHILLNRDGGLRPMTEEEFAEWNSDEVKDWYHRDDELRSSVAGLAILLGLSGLLGGNRNFGMSVRDDEFEGPTDEQFEKIISDPNAEETLTALKEVDPENCAICIRQSCPIRRERFNMTTFEAAVVRLSSTDSKN